MAGIWLSQAECWFADENGSVCVSVCVCVCVRVCVCVCEAVSMQERAYSLGCGMTVSLALGPCEDMIRL